MPGYNREEKDHVILIDEVLRIILEQAAYRARLLFCSVPGALMKTTESPIAKACTSTSETAWAVVVTGWFN